MFKKNKYLPVITFFTGMLIMGGVSSTFANWPPVPSGASSVAGWLGEVFNVNQSTTNQLVIQSDKVGIGTNTPSTKLDVRGNIRSSGTVCDSNGCINPAAADKYLPDNPATSDVNMNSRRIRSLATPALSTDAANKAYVDSKSTTDKYLPTNPPTNDVSMNYRKITSLGTPASSYDAANKAYVDAKSVSASGGGLGFPVVVSISYGTYCSQACASYGLGCICAGYPSNGFVSCARTCSQQSYSGLACLCK